MTMIGHFSGYAATRQPKATPPRFGANETDGVESVWTDQPQASDIQAETPATETSEKDPNLLEDAQQRAASFISKQELVRGGRGFVGVLLKGPSLNGALKEANPNSTLKERVLAIFNLAAVQFNAAFAGSTEVRSTATQELLQNVLDTFPKAVLFSSLDKVLASGFQDGALEELKQRFDIHSDPTEVRQALLAVLTEKPLTEGTAQSPAPPSEPAAE